MYTEGATGYGTFSPVGQSFTTAPIMYDVQGRSETACYLRLGLTHEATQDRAKRALRALALTEHPDKGGDAERSKLIQEAHAGTMDPPRRMEGL